MNSKDLKAIAEHCAKKMITVAVCVDGLHFALHRYDMTKRIASVNKGITWAELDGYRGGPVKLVLMETKKMLKKVGEK